MCTLVGLRQVYTLLFLALLSIKDVSEPAETSEVTGAAQFEGNNDPVTYTKGHKRVPQEVSFCTDH